MAQIVVSEFMDESSLAPLRERFEVLFAPELVDDRTALLAAMASAEALIVRNRTRVDAELLAAAPRLRVVGRLGVGLDNIALGDCELRGIVVHPATGANAQAVAEYVIAALLHLFRGAYTSQQRMIDGEWPRAELQGREVTGKQLALIGLGGIARLVTARARALGMRVFAYDPFIPIDDPVWGEVTPADSITELLRDKDAVSVHVPLTEETRHVLNADTMALLSAGAVVVNTARGGVVDDAALAAAVRRGHLSGAALDVFESEPLTAESAQIFAGLGNMLLTPHIAGLTAESNARVNEVTVANVLQTLTSD